LIKPQYEFETRDREKLGALPSVPEGFLYRSDTNDQWLGVDELKELIADVQPE